MLQVFQGKSLGEECQLAKGKPRKLCFVLLSSCGIIVITTRVMKIRRRVIVIVIDNNSNNHQDNRNNDMKHEGLQACPSD